MAYIQPRKNKDGEIVSYSIRVQRGYAPDGTQLKPYTATFKVDTNKTKRQNEKALNEFVVDFEQKCKLGLALDNRQTFAEYAEYVMKIKERQGAKRRTLERYDDLLKTINEHIGFMKLGDIRPQHLNNFYDILLKNGSRRTAPKAVPKKDIFLILRKLHITQKELSKRSGVAATSLTGAVQGKPIKKENAEKIAAALDMDFNKLFSLKTDSRPLAPKTVTEYHRLISTILSQADKEMLIPYNPAHKATPPKIQRKEPNYFQIEEIERIRDCLEYEPLKWKVITHLLLITGARRGEIAGLKWDVIDWNNNRIHICRSILYSSKSGIYEDTPKTKESDRYITLPVETMELLKEYRKWYLQQAMLYGNLWHNTNYLFFQEKAENAGMPINPDSITSHLSDFSAKYDLPHINPHAFRHTQASILYFNGIDSVSISKRLGHSKVSTTSDIYSHIIKQADERSAECIADVVLRTKHTDLEEERKKAE